MNIAAAEPHARQAAGKWGQLTLRLDVRDGRTVVADGYSRAPLRVAKPFYLADDGQACIYLMNPTGGLVQGDRLQADITLERAARLYLTTQAATKIYRMDSGAACQLTGFRLAPAALLEYFPDPVIPFAGSRYFGETVVHLAAGATAFLAEIITPGRYRRGEVFQYDYFHTKTRVYLADRLIFRDQLRLEPLRAGVIGLGMFEGYTHYGSLLIFSDRVSGELVRRINQRLADTEGVAGGVSLCREAGVVVRVLGNGCLPVEAAIRACWETARLDLIGTPAPVVRK